MIRKVKNIVPWTYVMQDLNGEEDFRAYYEEELHKTNQTKLRAEKVIKRKGHKFYESGKLMIVSLIAGQIKRYNINESIFPKPYERSHRNVKDELDLPNYATKSDFKKAVGADTSTFAKKADLASLKSDVHELNVDRLKTVPVDLS